jgi:hypothetical protein
MNYTGRSQGLQGIAGVLDKNDLREIFIVAQGDRASSRLLPK